MGTDRVTTSYQWFLDGRKLKNATGRGHRIQTSEIGKRLAIRVVHRAPSHTSLVLMSPEVIVKALPTLYVTSTPLGAGKVRFDITVKARGTVAPTGHVTMALGAARRTLKVVGGKTSTTIANIAPGRHTAVLSYNGSPRIESRRINHATTVR